MRNVTFYLSQETGRIFSCLFIVFFLIVLIKNDAHALVTPQISGGGYHSLALKSDGSVWSWGRNEFGQLGDGTKNDSAIPIQIHTLSDIIYIGRGWMHSLALKSDGSVWAWGRNNHGQLGDGTTIDSSVPFQLKNFDTVYLISGGGNHSLALKTVGTVWAWGRNDFGQLGNGSTNDSAVPIQVSILSNVTDISGGEFHSLALKSDGTVWAWGRNDFGQLGNGSTNDSSFPIQVNNLSDVIAVACGKTHSLALKSDNTVWAWGWNDFGQLGNSSSDFSSTPVQVSDLNNATALGRGFGHSLALTSAKNVWAWGYNIFGQLGNGTTNNSATPLRTSNLSSIVSISGGGFHSLAIHLDGTVWAWGLNNFGQLGDNTNSNSSVPKETLINLPSPTGDIAGIVSNAETGEGINNATVTIDDTGDTTKTSKIIGMDGVYVFQGVSVGEHTLTVQATGFKNRSQTITVEEGQSSNNRIDISLEPDGFPSPAPTPTPSGMGDIAGIVSNSTTGEGINNATVILDGTGDTTTTTTIFGFSGVYIFQGVPVGEHTITAEALDFKSNTQNIVVEEGQSINNRFDISLEPQDIPSPTPTPTPMGTGDIAGIVSNSITGEPINNATVTIADTGKTTISKTIRGQDGVYIFQDVSVGNHTLAAEATGFKSSVQTIAVEEGQSVNNRFDISLEPQSLPTPTPTPTGSGDIAGIVRNAETGEGINNATVTIEDSGNTTRTTTALGQKGVYVFQDISVGEHTLTARAVGFRSSTQIITVEEGQSVNNRFDISLEPDGFPSPSPTPTPSGLGDISGIVRNAKTGEGINNATVLIEDTGDMTKTTTALGQKGVYLFLDIPVGLHVFVAQAAGFMEARSINIVREGQNRVDFSLEPETSPTPAPECMAESMETDPEKTLEIMVGDSSDITVMLEGLSEGDCNASNVEVRAEVSGGDARIDLSSTSEITDENGAATFTIRALMDGNAKIKFEADGYTFKKNDFKPKTLKEKIQVKIGKASQ